MENQRILIIGGTGNIGTSLVKKMISNNRDFTLLIRSGDFLGNGIENCRYFFGDLLDKKGLIENVNDFDLVVNLAAVVRTINKKRYEENVLGVKNLTEVLKEKKIKKIIHFSSQNVNLKNKEPYGRSKEISEKLIRNSGLDYLIVRPNYVYGIDKSNDFYRMAFLISFFRLAPVIGDGNYKIQPVFKDDLVNIVFNFINNFKGGSIIEISGRETISINEIVGLIKRILKINPLTVHLPITVLRLFKRIIPFDLNSYTEDRISEKPFYDYDFSSFPENLEKILKPLK